MFNQLAALARARANAAALRVAVPAAFALVAGLFVLFAVEGLFLALLSWLEPGIGRIAAALICAAVAVVFAIAALLPLAFRRRPPPPPEADGILPQFLSLMAKSAPTLAPRQLLLTAALFGVAVALSTRGSKK